MTIEIMHSIWTLLLFAIFVGIVTWAWSGRSRKRFDAAAHSVLDDEKRSRAGSISLRACESAVADKGSVEGCCGKCGAADGERRAESLAGAHKHG